MNTLKIEGFVIKKIDYGTDDEIVTLMSNNDIISFIALGVRKLKSKNRVALQIGNYIEIEIFKARLTNRLSKLKKASLIIQPQIKIANTAEVLFELYTFISNVKNPSKKLFNSLIDVYSYFGHDYNDKIKTYVLFNFLDSIGHYPINNCCVECGRPDRINGFEFYKGGFLCALHNEHKRSLEVLESFQNLSLDFLEYSKTSLEINQEIYKEIKNFILENSFM